MDVTVFASYYEPWGYTPLESIAFSVPTITTSLTGFGQWVAEKLDEHKGVDVISRNDTNDSEVVEKISAVLARFSMMNAAEYDTYRASALEISKIALWENLIEFYYRAYDQALDRMNTRTHRAVYDGGGAFNEQINFVKQQLVPNTPTWRRLMVERKRRAAASARGALQEPLVVVDDGRPRAVRVYRQRSVDPVREKPDQLPRQAEIPPASGARERRDFPRENGRRACAVQGLHEGKVSCERTPDRLFQHGIRTAQFAEDILRRAGHPGRRLPQGGQRQERADGRRRTAVPIRLFHAEAVGLPASRRSATRPRTSRNCRSVRSATHRATGRAYRSPSRAGSSRRASGAATWDARSSTCSIRTTT